MYMYIYYNNAVFTVFIKNQRHDIRLYDKINKLYAI